LQSGLDQFYDNFMTGDTIYGDVFRTYAQHILAPIPTAAMW